MLVGPVATYCFPFELWSDLFIRLQYVAIPKVFNDMLYYQDHTYHYEQFGMSRAVSYVYKHTQNI